MRILMSGRAALGLFVAAPFAFAPSAFGQDTAPPGDVTLTGSATALTDYRFRGISQSDKRFAVQGTIGVSHVSGFYATVFGSSIDDYVANGSDQEIDLIAGWSRTYGGTIVDIGMLYYYYPGSAGANTDFVEPYVSVAHMVGPARAKLTVNYAPKQKALSVGAGKEDNLYVAGDVAMGIPTTPFSLSAHVGHSFGPSYLTIGKGYTDWGVGVSYTWKALTFGVNYVDTDKHLPIIDSAGRTRDSAKAGVVGSIGVAF
ncbi:MAG TPA: TorF family putative porin [Sphingomonadaceae bacterium]|nr:TorF family putative porin [Sphingomonadaceae bacterium]